MKRILIFLLQAVILTVSLIILSSFTVIFLRFDRLRIKYKIIAKFLHVNKNKGVAD